jgi:antitoxin (DNA-binding transcriptional repressor) of toxin-antitoxin stability system
MDMIKVNVADAKAHLSRYLDRIEKGEVVVLCRRNVPIAEIRRITQPPAKPRPVGIDRGMSVPESFFEELPEEVLGAFEGGADSE